MRDSRSNSSHELTAFAIVPFVATAAWYVLMLCALAIRNGQLRFMTDVVAMAIGAVILGLPTAVVITLLTLPAYLAIRRIGAVSQTSAAVAGASIGLGAALLFAATGDVTILSPLRGTVIGLTTGIVWWYVANHRASSMR